MAVAVCLAREEADPSLAAQLAIQKPNSRNSQPYLTQLPLPPPQTDSPPPAIPGVVDPGPDLLDAAFEGNFADGDGGGDPLGLGF